MAGVGFDARVVHGLDLELKDRIGKLAYWRGAIGQLGSRLEEFGIEAAGISRRCTFALVSRVRNYGGDELARRASPFSDTFEVLLFEGRYLCDDTLCDLWITLDLNALHEEGGLQPVELQCVQHRVGLGVRTIIEGQCDDPAGARSWRRSEGRRGRHMPDEQNQNEQRNHFPEGSLSWMDSDTLTNAARSRPVHAGLSIGSQLPDQTSAAFEGSHSMNGRLAGNGTSPVG